MCVSAMHILCFLFISHGRAGLYVPPHYMGHCPVPRAYFGALSRSPSAFLKESGAKNLLF